MKNKPSYNIENFPIQNFPFDIRFQRIKSVCTNHSLLCNNNNKGNAASICELGGVSAQINSHKLEWWKNICYFLINGEFNTIKN